jgi:hypothetical protein
MIPSTQIFGIVVVVVLFGVVVVVLLGVVVVLVGVVVVLFGVVVVVLLGVVVVLVGVVVVVLLGVVVLVDSFGAVVVVVPLAGVVVLVDEGTAIVVELTGDGVVVGDPELPDVPAVPEFGAPVVEVTKVVDDVPVVALRPLADVLDCPAFDPGAVLLVAPVGTDEVCSEATSSVGVAGGCDTTCAVPIATAPTTLTEIAAVRTAATPTCVSVGTLLRKGSDPSHASGPATTRTRPIDTSRNARTTAGSKCVPAHASSSALAAWGVIAGL